MMKASKSVNRWRPFVGVIAVGALAFGLSLRLEGAPVPGSTGKATDRNVAMMTKEVKEARAVSRIDQISGDQQQSGVTLTYGNLTRRMNGDIPVMPTIVVDYRDDDATRLRDAGLLRGPLPMPNDLQEGGVAAACAPGTCTFSVECNDGNPCTADTCDYAPGAPHVLCGGACSNSPVPDGQDGSVGDLHCEEHFGILCGGCDDGVYCNGLETCQGGSCAAGTSPCTGGDVCSEGLNVCHPPCGADSECVNLNDTTKLTCNGNETCSGTICQAGIFPCGSGGACGEKRCRKLTGTGNPAFPDSCTTDNDCIIEGATGACDVTGPVCLAGRCCTSDPEPLCKRRINTPTCLSGPKLGGPCQSNADCPSGTCNLADNCTALGGLFYGTDQGRMLKNDIAGLLCVDDIDTVPFNCPKYSSGIAPLGVFTQLLGPISDSPLPNPTFGVALNKLGDDYKLSNDPGPASDNYFKLHYLRFAGGMVVPERITFEFYDASGNFIEDIFFISTAAFAIYPIQFQPAITIPSEGFVVARVASRFAPNAQIVWAATDAVDVGSNNNTSLWINTYPPMTVSSTLGTLAFELEGEKTAPPSGACCTGLTGACDNAVIPWVCKGTGDIYLGDGVKCATCDSGPQSGEYCRLCSDDSSPCNKDADCGGTATCTTTPPVSHCTGGGICVAEPACAEGACCNPTTGTCAVVSEATCTGGGGNYQGNGTDCDADNGRDAAQQHCCPQPIANQTGGDNCSDAIVHVIAVPKKCAGGSNDGLACEVAGDCPGGACVPNPGVVKVITIEGNNNGATSTQANPDSCFQYSTDPNADPGWWEAFTIVDNCAMVRLDHCCSDPVEQPTWSIIYSACPCGASTLSSPNPYAPPFAGAAEAGFSRGLPYCADDDNLWQNFPFLKAGTYYYPVYSALAGGHGDYRLHISVEACLLAACCQNNKTCLGGSNDGTDCTNELCTANGVPYACCTGVGTGTCQTVCTGGGTCTGNKCTDGVNKLECDALGGFFLAPPNKVPAVSACTDNVAPCGTGSCCTGPGKCEDISLGTLETPANCTVGNYVGGVRCFGGVCSVGSPPASCALDTDCDSGANGPCLPVGAGSLTQQSPCPICEMEDAGQCQLFDDILSFAVSDWQLGDSGLVLADDFIPLDTTLSTVCTWGFYINGDPAVPDSADDCGPQVTADVFRIRVYTNDTAGNGRMPKTLVGESMATSQRGTLPTSSLEARISNEMYGYQMTLDTPITGLTIGNLYWLEIANDPTANGPPKCLWFWAQKTQTSSSYSYGGSNAGYVAGFETPFDQVFCTNFGLTPSTLGAQTGACCFCDGTCQVKTLADCVNATGIWHVEASACPITPPGFCPTSAPANDACVAPGGAVPTITAGTFTVTNNCATTDGLSVPSDFGGSQIDFDMWYYFIAPSACDLEVNMCSTGTVFDSMFAVYHDDANPTVCPPCPLTPADNTTYIAGIGQDETCTGVAVGGPGFWVASDQIGRQAVINECFLLRIGSFPGSRGTSSVTVICGGGGTPAPDLIADPTGIKKSRFISFSVPSGANPPETALRVKLVSLHHPVPGYTGGPTTFYTMFEGQSMFVGPPVQYFESGTTGASFMASKLQCAPYYQDWSTISLLTVTGEAIAPSSSFDVEHLANSCQGNEGTCTAVSAALTIVTARSGDVIVNEVANFADISSLVAKFQAKPGSPIKSRAKISAGDARGLISIAPNVGFGDIAVDVDAFKSKPYPYKPGKCTGNPAKACLTATDCTNQGTTGPCILCP